jgi:hypothetical protein
MKKHTKQWGTWQPNKITPVLPITRQKFKQNFKQYLEFFAVFQNLRLLHNFTQSHYQWSAKPWLSDAGLTPQLDQILSQFYIISAHFC